MASRSEEGDPELFPIVEVFGYAADAKSKPAKEARAKHWCRFANADCEKFRQQKYGYCRVIYSAKDDGGVRFPYAVCDHRLDGDPIQAVLKDAFGDDAERAVLVPEIKLPEQEMSYDFAAYVIGDGGIEKMIAIE